MASGLGGSAMHSEKYSLTEAFREKSPDEARQLYDDWATGYDRDNLVKGYRMDGCGPCRKASEARCQPDS